MQVWKMVVASAAIASSAHSMATEVRVDFTLTGVSATDLSTSTFLSIPGFVGTTASGYAILDLGNITQTVDSGVAVQAYSSGGCPIYEDGVCSFTYGNARPIVTNWGVTSVLGFVEMAALPYHTGVITREYMPYVPQMGSSYWMEQIYVNQDVQYLSTTGINERSIDGISIFLESWISPIFTDLYDLSGPVQLGGDIRAFVQVTSEVASWTGAWQNFLSQGYSQNFSINSITFTPLQVPEPDSVGLLVVGLLLTMHRRTRIQR